jgi:hypothetical protein
MMLRAGFCKIRAPSWAGAAIAHFDGGGIDLEIGPFRQELP